MSEDNDKERRERIKRLRKQDEPESESSISPEELSDQMAQWQRGQLAVTAPIEPGLLVIGQRDEGELSGYGGKGAFTHVVDYVTVLLAEATVVGFGHLWFWSTAMIESIRSLRTFIP